MAKKDTSITVKVMQCKCGYSYSFNTKKCPICNTKPKLIDSKDAVDSYDTIKDCRISFEDINLSKTLSIDKIGISKRLNKSRVLKCANCSKTICKSEITKSFNDNSYGIGFSNTKYVSKCRKCKTINLITEYDYSAAFSNDNEKLNRFGNVVLDMTINGVDISVEDIPRELKDFIYDILNEYRIKIKNGDSING